MANVEKISIALPADMATLVRNALQTGDYASSSEVIREALREWKARRAARSDAISEIRRLWDEGIKSGRARISTSPRSRSVETPQNLVPAAALFWDGWAPHRAVRAKNAAVARLRLKQCLTARALVEILARVRRHDLFALLTAIRAGEHGL